MPVGKVAPKGKQVESVENDAIATKGRRAKREAPVVDEDKVDADLTASFVREAKLSLNRIKAKYKGSLVIKDEETGVATNIIIVPLSPSKIDTKETDVILVQWDPIAGVTIHDSLQKEIKFFPVEGDESVKLESVFQFIDTLIQE